MLETLISGQTHQRGSLRCHDLSLSHFGIKVRHIQRALPQVPQGLEHDRAPIRRHACPAQHLDGDRLRRHLNGEAHGRLHLASGTHTERNHRGLPRGEIDATDLATTPGKDGPVIGSPSHARRYAMHSPCLLVVTLDSIRDFASCTRSKIKHIQGALKVVAAHEGQLTAIMRRGRRTRSAHATGNAHTLAGGKLQSINRIDAFGRILRVLKGLAACSVQTEVHVATIR